MKLGKVMNRINKIIHSGDFHVMLCLFIVLGIFFVAGLSIGDGVKKAQAKGAAFSIPKIHYIKDERSGLCFAYFLRVGSHTGGPALTSVPCEKVEKFLEPYDIER